MTIELGHSTGLLVLWFSAASRSGFSPLCLMSMDDDDDDDENDENGDDGDDDDDDDAG